MNSKVILFFMGLIVAIATTVFVLIGDSGARYAQAQAAFEKRLIEARDAKTNDAPERLLEGTVRASTTIATPAGRRDAVVWAAWTQVRVSAGSKIYRAEDLSFGDTRFEIETAEGLLVVDAQVRGASDLVRREQGPPGRVELAIVDGDHVTVLGAVSTRDGQPGFFANAIIVKGSLEQWRKVATIASMVSIPEQP